MGASSENRMDSRDLKREEGEPDETGADAAERGRQRRERRGRCEICVRFAGTSSGRCASTCPPCGGKAMTPHQSPASREIGG